MHLCAPPRHLIVYRDRMRACAPPAFGMVNYYLHKYLSQPERKPVGPDEKFEWRTFEALDLGCHRSHCFGADSLFLSPSDSD